MLRGNGVGGGDGVSACCGVGAGVSTCCGVKEWGEVMALVHVVG